MSSIKKLLPGGSCRLMWLTLNFINIGVRRLFFQGMAKNFRGGGGGKNLFLCLKAIKIILFFSKKNQKHTILGPPCPSPPSGRPWLLTTWCGQFSNKWPQVNYNGPKLFLFYRFLSKNFFLSKQHRCYQKHENQRNNVSLQTTYKNCIWLILIHAPTKKY